MEPLETKHRVQITGSRDFENSMMMTEILSAIPIPAKNVTLVHGGAAGADSLAGRIGREFGFTVEVHPADWAQYGKRAGYLRNQAMADLLNPATDFVLAFFKRGAGNRGTQMMVDICKRAGIDVTEYWSD